MLHVHVTLMSGVQHFIPFPFICLFFTANFRVARKKIL